ncbi:helicase-exonuclease AddAB subunit AddA [Pediococcus claussenii]|uniref:ATP-dependent helicase/nuclease subunit A n=1 Tax=Pediococcus claussenii (strain ATCC BAA-344 / DSM 14800 / JCM 18046 / KCTC 3811 / LMG 21948 / P06) TaxID=701521 RepID=G8PC82_PEDCP|nr:helicase-exonuclease AddAB subunit AddA [Pediococcus claussenii]AEV96060.1 ATP-dependent helicase/nuclease subunit A [Pediococcus claussenii ATCC BAA-344]ANZ69544.1 helicase-exonuclease AddAB subunit AddA [Pediococcus claussenii]ANZ71361.1 helicase-exonuclease AddAB subunit AddA [Pediococcus claussenii]KRN19416.1 addA protein [Pediococcus claussenii]
MNKRQYTESQQHAIEDDGRNILVSASAGSGKTSVLVERVIQKVLKGEDVDRLLVVTFTDAAAKEMKDRIRKAITDQINVATDMEQRQHLLQQLDNLANASISTLHSFCLSIIQTYYYVIDLDPAFRVMSDQTESELLKETVWEDLRENFYQSRQETFSRITRNFSNDRSDQGMEDLVMELINFADANPDPIEWLNQLSKNYEVVENDVMNSPFIKNKVIPFFEHELHLMLNQIQDALDLANEGGAILEKSRNVIQAEKDSVEAVLSNMNQNWNSFKAAMENVDFSGRLSQKKDEITKTFNQEVKPLRGGTGDFKNGYRDSFNQLKGGFIKFNEEELIDVLKDSQSIVAELVSVVKIFMTKFAEEKKRRHVLEFSDFEHFALQILTSDNDNSRMVRESFQNKFNEVIVDEYQDINPLQETILTTVSRPEPGNMFMVGDVKQSIYAFRMAEPGLFLKKNNQFKEDDNPNQRIILAENFRSMQNIDMFTNFVFNQIMDEKVGQIEYDEDAQLKYGAAYYPENFKNSTEVLIYEKNTNSGQVVDKADSQIRMIAEKIQKMIQDDTQVYDKGSQDMRSIRYSDIALLESNRNLNLKLVEIFKEYGIPIDVGDANDYFQTTEISIVMDFLKVIDNPYQDIPLAAVLRSPIVGLNENELAFLRIGKKNGNYYEAVLKFYNEPQNEVNNEFKMKLKNKVVMFITELEKLRMLARTDSVSNLLWTIFNDTGYLDYVGGMPDGPQRQNNLHALYERARDYEQSSFKGLFQFVRFVEKMRQRDDDLSENPVKTDDEAVAVMTIHGSKGLEFPIVFLIDATHRFNLRDVNSGTVLDRSLGIGITLKDLTRHLLIDTPQKMIIQRSKLTESLAEEMRVLYVALTRAQQKLIITGSTDNAEKMIENWKAVASGRNELLDEKTRALAKSFMDWIGPAILRDEQVAEKYDVNLAPGVSRKANVSLQIFSDEELGNEGSVVVNKPKAQSVVNKQVASSKDLQWISDVLDFEYHDQGATTTAAYQSVSEVKRQFDDPDKLLMNFSEVEENQQFKSVNRYLNTELAKPKFLQDTKQPVASEIGTATHLVLQKIDLNRPVTQESIEELIADLVENRILSSEIAQKIKIKSILNFFDTELGRLMLGHASQVHREEPFSLLIPAKRIFSQVKGDQKLLIHGIIDAYIVIEGRVIVLDYKTDFILPGSPDHGVASIVDKYRGQINMYGIALQDILKMKVNEKYIYLLSTGQLVSVN